MQAAAAEEKGKSEMNFLMALHSSHHDCFSDCMESSKLPQTLIAAHQNFTAAVSHDVVTINCHSLSLVLVRLSWTFGMFLTRGRRKRCDDLF
jgi:hypothetical protein